jgi:hypothetical protein
LGEFAAEMVRSIATIESATWRRTLAGDAVDAALGRAGDDLVAAIEQAILLPFSEEFETTDLKFGKNLS